MKRTYITPSTVLIEVKTASMRATSRESIKSEEAETGTPENPVNFSRREKWGDCWADEEEDDEE